MERQGLRERLRQSYLDDTAQPYLWSDDLLNAFIEEAQQEAQIRSRFLSDRFEVSVTAGNTEVALPDGTLEIERLRIPRLNPLRLTSWNELDESGSWEERSGTPTHYAFVPKPLGGDGVLTLYPKPTFDATLKITAQRQPTAMTSDNDSPELPEHLHLYLLDWAAFRAYSLKDSDTNDEARAAKHEAAFTAAFGGRHDASALKQRADNRSHRVRANRDYF